MYERAVSDVVIVGAGSAGLSCAWQLANSRPEVVAHIVSREGYPTKGNLSS